MSITGDIHKGTILIKNLSIAPYITMSVASIDDAKNFIILSPYNHT